MNLSVVAGDHTDVHVERTAVRGLAELVGFPHAPGAGLLTSGGSAATIVCLAGARGRAAAAAGHDVRRDGLAGGPGCCAMCRMRRIVMCGARSNCSGLAVSRSGPFRRSRAAG